MIWHKTIKNEQFCNFAHAVTINHNVLHVHNSSQYKLRWQCRQFQPGDVSYLSRDCQIQKPSGKCLWAAHQGCWLSWYCKRVWYWWSGWWSQLCSNEIVITAAILLPSLMKVLEFRFTIDFGVSDVSQVDKISIFPSDYGLQQLERETGPSCRFIMQTPR